jgi:hypothetical protein
MKTGLLSLFTGAALMGGVAVAQAGEPITLDSSQLDTVHAGGIALSSGASDLSNAEGSTHSCVTCGAPARSETPNTKVRNDNSGAAGGTAIY